MTREKDTVSTEDAGYKTESGNHAAGGPANDTTQVNREPNINADQQKQSAGSQGGTTMTEQSIGGRNAQDGISGTPSGTQGAQSGQGIDQGGLSQQTTQQTTQQNSQGQSDYLGGTPGNAQKARPDIQYSPQESNRDQYGDQETGATSGQVGDGRTPQQVAHSGSQPTQHSEGRDDGALPDAQRLGGLIPVQQQQQKQQQQQPQRDAKGGPGSPDNSQSEQSAHPHAGEGGGHGGQHSGGMGGERGGDLHNVGAQSGQTGRGGLGGNNEGMQSSGGPGNQQSGNAQLDQSADGASIDALDAGGMGGEREGMGHRGSSQQSDKAGNSQSDVRNNPAVPNNRTDNEQSDRHLGMQGSNGEPGHDVDDIGSKPHRGSQGGSPDDQR